MALYSSLEPRVKLAVIAIALLSHGTSAWMQMNFASDRTDWFRREGGRSAGIYKSTFKNIVECHPLNNRNKNIFDGIAIWNRQEIDQTPNIRAIGLYHGYFCEASGGTTAGVRKIPYSIVVLDPEKLNGISVINLKLLGLDFGFESWRPINVEEETRAGGYLEHVPESALKDSVIIWRSEKITPENTKRVQGWQPFTGFITHINPGAWAKLRENNNLCQYLREMGERILNPLWRADEGAMNMSALLGKELVKALPKRIRGEPPAEVKYFWEPYLSIESPPPVELLPFVEVTRRPEQHLLQVAATRSKKPKPVQNPSVKEIEQTIPIPPNSVSQQQINGQPASNIEPPVQGASMQNPNSAMRIPASEVNVPKIPKDRIISEFERNPDKGSWFLGLRAQWEYITAVYRYARELYDGYLSANGISDPRLTLLDQKDLGSVAERASARNEAHIDKMVQFPEGDEEGIAISSELDQIAPDDDLIIRLKRPSEQIAPEVVDIDQLNFDSLRNVRNFDQLGLLDSKTLQQWERDFTWGQQHPTEFGEEFPPPGAHYGGSFFRGVVQGGFGRPYLPQDLANQIEMEQEVPYVDSDELEAGYDSRRSAIRQNLPDLE
ncbi:hypothetical protein H072_2655 [Dactylellina haptotyla CBS 200.50]|uniref:Uncharacterized protein n=1 Tax=Dactylellina haptotyla (strain CBS 200.50) TaxID=1284197 RepID=S8AKI7_DACHA|nr:hypothetical protein H072_2655 [Dactylellina haptotyla CBS 200.50]